MSYTTARDELDTLLSQTTRGSITAPDLKAKILGVFDAFEDEILETAPVYAGGLLYTYSSTTTMADPGSGTIRFNHATLSSATAAAIDDLSALGGDVSSKILTWDDSTDTIKGLLTVAKRGAPETYVAYHLTALTDNSGWTQLTLSYVGGAGSLADGDPVVCTFERNGNAGGTVSPSFTGVITLGNATFYVTFTSGTPYLNFDANDYLGYDRTNNILSLVIGGATALNFGAGTIDFGNSDTTLSRAAAGQVAVEGKTVLDVGHSANLEKGFTSTAYNIGTVSSGTTTPDPANGNLQRYINGGAHTLAAPTAAGDYGITIQVTNNASAGAITLSGFTITSGDTISTTNGDDFLLHIVKLNGFTRCYKEKLQ